MLRRFFRWWAKNYIKIARKKEFGWGMITFATFRLFLEHGMSTTNSKGNDFAKLRDFYAWGAFVGQYPEFDRQLALSVKEIRATGNIKGAAVRFRHPTKGPFDSAEQRIIRDAIRKGVGTTEERAVVMIHLELGPNPQSIARLRTRDFEKFEVTLVENGTPKTHTRYQLALPRVKKRTEHRETIVRPINKELGLILEALKKDDPDSFLFHWLSSTDPESSIGRAMKSFAIDGNLTSPRTGLLLNITPRRFRSTFGTERTREGGSPVEVARDLDHSDLQNIRQYVETSSYIIDQVGDGFDTVFAPFAASFRGKIVDRHEQAKSKLKILPASSPLLPILDVGGIGSCGRDVRTDGLCKLAPPLTCYACGFFAAFRDGPHDEVLLALENLQSELKVTSDTRIPMQLDEVISAARQLVAQIRAEGQEVN
jgi:integrase